MKKQLFSIISIVFIITSCSTPILNNTNQYSDLDKEYSQFKTKALTQSYLKKKMNKWLSNPIYSKNLVREIEYASYKHRDILKAIVALEPTMFTNITTDTGVSQKRIENPFENYIQYIDPFHTTSFAIQGNGYFMLTDKEGKIYYTKDGVFYENIQGQLKNSQGLILVDAATAINMGLPYTAPAVTQTMINNRDTGWTPLSFVNTNGYVPWWLSGAGMNGNYTIQVKKTFFLDGSKITGNETMIYGSDNYSYVIINGHLLTPTAYNTWISYKTISIGSYLKDGANTILIQGSNVEAQANPAGLYISSIINAGINGTSVNLETNSTWAARAYSTYDINPPQDNAFATTVNDIVLADTDETASLEASIYGATILQAPQLSMSDFTIDLSEKQNLGKVISTDI